MTSYTGYIVQIDTRNYQEVWEDEPNRFHTTVQIEIPEGVHLDTNKPITIIQEEKE